MITSNLVLFVNRIRVRITCEVVLRSNHFAASVLFNEENIQRTMTKFRSGRQIRLATDVPAKKAAVLLPLCIVNGKVSLLYTLRSSNLKTHKAQVSFPGGMRDLSDKSFEETALRETEEELNLNRSRVHVWGSGNTIVSPNKVCIVPVVGHVRGDLNLNELSANASEVEEMFVVALEDLCDAAKTGYTQFKGSHSLPIFLGARRRIWGLTGIMTHTFLKSLLPHAAYNHRIKYVQVPRAKTFDA